MILDKKVNIKVYSRNIKKLKSLGFDNIKIGDNVLVDISLLPPNSHTTINVKCDVCQEKKQISYKEYNKSLKSGGYYACSSKCAFNKNKQTNIKKYGVEHISQSKLIQKKVKETNLKNYGVENVFQNKEIQKKIKHTFIEKYDVDNPSKYNDFKIKKKETNLKKYGNENFVLSEYFYNNVNYFKNVDNIKYIETIKTKFLNNYNLTLIDIYKSNNQNVYKLKCDNGHNHIFDCESDMLSHRIRYNTILCTICNPKNSYSKSGLEIKILNFIKKYYNSNIIENHRINGKEIDIYLPDLKIGFEINGIWWHNELNVPMNYHKDKKDICLKNNINLFFIYEDEWEHKQNIVKSMILHKIGKTTKKYYARKCNIKKITNKESLLFLDHNHIQGRVNASINLGLFYENKLISIMTFNKRRLGIGKISDKKEYELVRYCTLLNNMVIGGANKLFNFFINNYDYNSIISFANYDYSNGDIYYKLGFELTEKQKPNYYYVYDKKRKHRFMFRKDKLVKDGFDPNKSAHDIMLERKIYRIYNSGVLKFIYK